MGFTVPSIARQRARSTVVDGHSWISVTRDGSTQYFGLWPDGHPDVPDNANGNTPDRLPGFRPLPCTVLFPALHASSNRSRSAALVRRGWNRNAVVATFLPLVRIAHF